MLSFILYVSGKAVFQSKGLYLFDKDVFSDNNIFGMWEMFGILFKSGIISFNSPSSSDDDSSFCFSSSVI